MASLRLPLLITFCFYGSFASSAGKAKSRGLFTTVSRHFKHDFYSNAVFKPKSAFRSKNSSVPDNCTLENVQRLGSEVLKSILSKYNQNVVPMPAGVDVEIELIIQTVTEISEISYR